MPELKEIGFTGLKVSSGLVQEEFLPQLQGQNAAKVYTEMRSNDPIVGAVLFAIGMYLRKVPWTVDPWSDESVDVENAEFVRQCMDDMSHSWSDWVAEALSMLPYGWAYFETVYKVRGGPSEKDGSRRSDFTDGKLGWRKFSIRGQDTLRRWEWDESGAFLGLVQSDPRTGNEVLIPIEKSLLVRTSRERNNPEGKSILRNAYRPWWFKKRIEEIEAIGIERELAGLPKIGVPQELLDPNAPDAFKAARAKFEEMGKNIRQDEQSYILMPNVYDENGNNLYTFELVSTGGTRAIDPGPVIERYSRHIAMTVLADVILIGHESTGSFALSVNKSEMFSAALQAFLDELASVVNAHGIPRLLEFNGMPMDRPPKVCPGKVEKIDFAAIGEFIWKTSQAGAEWFPDDNLDGHLRRIADLPPKEDALQDAE